MKNIKLNKKGKNMMTNQTLTAPHIGPGKKITTLYTDAELHAAIKERSDDLGLSMSQYIVNLALADLQNDGKSFSISSRKVATRKPE